MSLQTSLERKRKERDKNSRGREIGEKRGEKKGEISPTLDEESGVTSRLPRLYRFDVSNLLAISEPDNFYEAPDSTYVPPGGSRPSIFSRATLRETGLRRDSRRSNTQLVQLFSTGCSKLNKKENDGWYIV